MAGLLASGWLCGRIFNYARTHDVGVTCMHVWYCIVVVTSPGSLHITSDFWDEYRRGPWPLSGWCVPLVIICRAFVCFYFAIYTFNVVFVQTYGLMTTSSLWQDHKWPRSSEWWSCLTTKECWGRWFCETMIFIYRTTDTHHQRSLAWHIDTERHIYRTMHTTRVKIALEWIMLLWDTLLSRWLVKRRSHWVANFKSHMTRASRKPFTHTHIHYPPRAVCQPDSKIIKRTI